MFNPNNVIENPEQGHCDEYYKNGKPLNISVIYAGLRYFENEFLKKRNRECSCIMDPKYKAWLVHNTLQDHGWKFVPSTFIKSGISAVMMYDLKL